MTFLETIYGKPHTVKGLGNWFADRCTEAGVPGRVHGLRKAGATLAAQNGATPHQLMAMADAAAGRALHQGRAAAVDGWRRHEAPDLHARWSRDRGRVSNTAVEPLGIQWKLFVAHHPRIS